MRLVNAVAALCARLVVTILGVTTLLFVLSLFSGNPAELYSPPGATAEMIERTEQRMGLNDAVLLRFGRALLAPFRLDFGESYVYQGPVLGKVVDVVGNSFMIVIASLVVAGLLAIVVGTIGALYPTRLIGKAVMVSSYVSQAIPYFWMVILLVLVFAINLNVLPATGSDGWRSIVIPVVSLGVFGYATMSRLTRGELLDIFQLDYIFTARSIGVSPRRVLFAHALPSAAPPLLAWMGIQFSFLFGSLLVLEPILNRRGIGSLLVLAVNQRDFPVVQVCVVMLAVLITTVNFFIDRLIRVLDPRIDAGVSQ